MVEASESEARGHSSDAFGETANLPATMTRCIEPGAGRTGMTHVAAPFEEPAGLFGPFGVGPQLPFLAKFAGFCGRGCQPFAIEQLIFAGNDVRRDRLLPEESLLSRIEHQARHLVGSDFTRQQRIGNQAVEPGANGQRQHWLPSALAEGDLRAIVLGAQVTGQAMIGAEDDFRHALEEQTQG